MMRIGLLLLSLSVVSLAAWGEETAADKFRQAFFLEKQGQFGPAIQCLEPLVDSNALGAADTGRAWTLLGYAYQETGQYQKAQKAFEQALRIFEGDARYLTEYANALDCLGGFYRSTGQPQEAARVWSQALDVYKQEQNHRGIAKTYTNLAALALEQKHVRSAKESMEKAVAETQAWIASEDGDNQAALAEYQRTLAFRRHSHGENFPLTGWAYLILGRSYAANGRIVDALTNMRTGLTILEQTEGQESPRYLTGQILYARVLDQFGSHAEASRLMASAQKRLLELYRGQCIGCTIGASSFR